MHYSFYGDDFTGSTDVLETLARAAIPAALFLAIPTPEDLAAFPNLQALGIAGDSRSRTPAWMSANLPPIFAALKSFAAPITHYKTCSTFDSAPHIGNIGRAIELGLAAFHRPGAPSQTVSPFEVGSNDSHPSARSTLPPPTATTPLSPRLQPWDNNSPQNRASAPEERSPHLAETTFVPIVVGAPHLGRFVRNGHLYASANDTVYPIHEHPTMSRHPVTPMREPDLRRHLASQTNLPIALLDEHHLTQSGLDQLLHQKPAAILFDTFDEPSLVAVGRLIWHQAQQTPLFAVGSSGLTESLIPTWRAQSLIPSAPTLAPPTAVDQLLVLSGSCSPITQSQIEHALANGFHAIPIDPAALIANPTAPLAEALACIQQGRSPILYTALGPLAPTTQPHAAELGIALGKLLHAILTRSRIRTLLCGGDTASHALQELPIRALTYAAPLTPGAPLCRAHAPHTPFHHAEFILKGGQIGPPNFFTLAKTPGAPPSRS